WTSRAQSSEPGYDWVESETVRILTDRTDGIWLYQENAVIAASGETDARGGAKDKPYFQVVIHLRTLGPDEVLATTYRLATPEARQDAKGFWARSAQPFGPDWIGEAACMSRMHRVAAGFWQGAAACPNDYKGAVKVDSRSIRTRDTYVNWDRGFDAAGIRVWGPARGGYIFTRMEHTE
ncbi:MAG: CpcT/CpeT family chromophore lyase, partial [Hyphomonas sp.]|uniref:CpcT/CpeT family chromophore lyase n=1 Tax=Hyphomonas sp. TaxID=87 RepID=UPI0034A06842